MVGISFLASRLTVFRHLSLLISEKQYPDLLFGNVPPGSSRSAVPDPYDEATSLILLMLVGFFYFRRLKGTIYP